MHMPALQSFSGRGFEGAPCQRGEGHQGADSRAFKGSAQAVLFRHLGEHLPWPLVSRQAYRNECVGNQWRMKVRGRERRRTRR